VQQRAGVGVLLLPELTQRHRRIAADAEAVPELRPLAEFLAIPGRGIIR
jgi:hypothetical protein